MATTENRIENLELWAIGRKDPAGQRVADLLRTFEETPEMQSLSTEDRAAVMEAASRTLLGLVKL